jgi:hypothetical protein
MTTRAAKQVRASADIRPFRFESYGVKVEITGNEQWLIDKGAAVARTSLLDRVKVVGEGPYEHRFKLTVTPKGTYSMYQNDERVTYGRSEWKFLRFFDSMIRIAVGEYARGFVFMHAGVVGWKGKALVIPADSFQGKSTLVAELVRQGAEYYSDEYAILDDKGLVHAFPRRISMRTTGRPMRIYDLTPEELGGHAGSVPVPVGTLVFTRYRPNTRWRSATITPGEALLRMIPHVLPIRRDAQFAMRVLNIVANDAIIVSSPRGEADAFAEKLIKYVDKHVV